jgi:hypothetical protein
VIDRAPVADRHVVQHIPTVTELRQHRTDDDVAKRGVERPARRR